MISAMVMSCALLATCPSEPPKTPDADREAYEAAKAKAGRDPGANVKLALWCEAHGLEAEKLKHLSLAALADPTNATARALLGLVSEGGRWSNPESVAARLKSDPDKRALRAEYEARRNRTNATADDQWQLARWCEKNGLVDEATAHDTAVTRLEPSREAAWKKLGCIKYEGRWMTPARIEAFKAEREAQILADKKWLALLDKYKNWLGKPARKTEVEDALLNVSDPRAVPAIWRVFATGAPRDQAMAVRLFGQVDSTEASRRLAILAVFGANDTVRRLAIETLRGRDFRGTLDPVIALLRDPIKFMAKPNQGPDSPGVIFVEGEEANYQRIYRLEDVAPPRVPPVSDRQMALVLQRMDTAIESANAKFAEDLQSLQNTNQTIEVTNKNALTALKGVTGRDFGLDRNAWMGWSIDSQGYAFKPLASKSSLPKETFTEYVDRYVQPSNACFAAGTTVQTVEGPRAIEEIRIGDRILTQDTTSGALSYQPALAVFHNEPANTLRVKLGTETIVATGIHRFWKAGIGWVMARDLKPGDSVRMLGGITRVQSIEPDKHQPVFNLEVARGTSFFVGLSGVLVHDNSLVRSVAKPFDLAPEAVATQAAK